MRFENLEVGEQFESDVTPGLFTKTAGTWACREGDLSDTQFWPNAEVRRPGRGYVSNYKPETEAEVMSVYDRLMAEKKPVMNETTKEIAEELGLPEENVTLVGTPSDLTPEQTAAFDKAAEENGKFLDALQAGEPEAVKLMEKVAAESAPEAVTPEASIL